MAVTNVTNHLVFPTERDLNGGIAGQGRLGSEVNISQAQRSAQRQQNIVIGGFAPVPTGAGFTKTIPAGVAVIDGYYIRGDLSNSIAFSPSTTNYLFLRLIYLLDPVDSLLKVSAIQLETNTTGVRPANAVRLARVVTDGSGVTSQADERPQGKRCWGVIGSGANIVNRGSDDWTVTSSGSYREITFNPAFLRGEMGVQVTPFVISTTNQEPRAGSHYTIVSSSVIRVVIFAVDSFTPTIPGVTTSPFAFEAEL